MLALPAMLAILWWAARESYADLQGHRLIVAWVVRVALVTVLVLALAGAEIVRPARQLAVVFAVDASHSVPEAERERALEVVRRSLRHRGGEHTCAMVVFGRRAMLEAERLSRTEDVTIASEVGGGHTDMAAGLRLALGVIPPETAGRIVLCSDGNENVGAAEEQVLAASAARVSVDVLPLATREAADS
ncbi:MAG: vWA domain-containing protein, partial [Gemmatimonadota bacterium]|nr:vWA domain-containing protein [Gemmatimonadota bacterium]